MLKLKREEQLILAFNGVSFELEGVPLLWNKNTYNENTKRSH